MSINIASNFHLFAQLPLDERTVVADVTARDAIPAGERFDGMVVYVTTGSATYQLQGGITNLDWVVLVVVQLMYFQMVSLKQPEQLSWVEL